MAAPNALYALAGVVACLVGCSSGGGGGGSNSNAGSARPPSFFETEEYFASAGLDVIGASTAYADLGSGDGIVVGVIDTGIDVDHPEFAGQIDRDSVDIATGSEEFVDDVDGHGTAVAGVIGARRNGKLSHGVAFDARILAVRADLPGSCATGCLLDPVDVAEATDYAVDNGARVINYSLGGSGGGDATLDQALARAAQADRVLVFSAGNTAADDPLYPAGFAASSKARGRAIAVGALDAEGRIASFSNRAGAAADHFLVAPGVDILAPSLGGGASLVSGTSFAAPHVAGAAALVLEAAPFLSADQVVELLLETATDLGTSGTDPVYGRGLLNLAAALAPQGALQVPLDDTVDGAGADLAATGLSLGRAFGRGPELGTSIFVDGYGRPYGLDLDRRRGAVRATPALDRWLAADSGPLALTAGTSELRLGLRLDQAHGSDRQAGRADGAPAGDTERFAIEADLGGASRLAAVHGWGLHDRFGLAADREAPLGDLLSGGAFASPYLGLVDGGDGLSLSQDLGRHIMVRLGVARAGRDADPFGDDDNALMVGEVGLRLGDRGHLGVQIGQLDEPGRLLDSSGGGALRMPEEASTTFVGLSGHASMTPNVDVFAHAGVGVTRPEGRARGLLRDFSTVQSSSFGAGVARRGVLAPGDRLVLAVVQPLRVERGTAQIDRPLARTFEGDVVRRRDAVDLAPEGRQIDLEVGYRLAPTRVGEISLNWLTQLQPGHDAEAAPAHAVALRLRRELPLAP